MEKENNKKGLVTLLVIIIIALALLCALLATSTISFKKEKTSDNTQTSDNKIKTISDVVGEYELEINNLKSEDEQFNKGTLKLVLYNNGIFTYVFRQYFPQGMLGSYIVDGNKIILTAWFSTGSSPELSIITGTKTLTINEDNTITDSNTKIKQLLDINITTVTLNKTSKEITSFDPGDRMSAACLKPDENGSCGKKAGEMGM